MSSPLKNRVVGTLVLLALGALIVPELLKEPDAPTPEQFEVIPLRPELGQVPPSQDVPTDNGASQVQLPGEVARVEDDDVAVQAEPEPAQVKPVEVAQVDDKPAQPEPKPAQPESKPVPATAQEKPQDKLPAPPSGFDDNAFVIQMGAFKNHEAAANLVTKLREGGYKAFRQQSGGLSRVYVGPELDRNKLELMLPKLNGFSGLKGRVMGYEPLDN